MDEDIPNGWDILNQTSAVACVVFGEEVLWRKILQQLEEGDEEELFLGST